MCNDDHDCMSQHLLSSVLLLLFSQEVEKLLLVDFPFVVDRLSSDISDPSLKTRVGDKLLNELDAVSVKPIEAVKTLSARKK